MLTLIWNWQHFINYINILKIGVFQKQCDTLSIFMLPAGWSFVQLQDLQKMFHFTEVAKKNHFFILLFK